MPLRTGPLLYAATALSLLPNALRADNVTYYYFVGPTNSFFSDPNNWSTTNHGPGGSPPSTGQNTTVFAYIPLTLYLDSAPDNVYLNITAFAGSAPDSLLTVDSSADLHQNEMSLGPFVTFNQTAGTITSDTGFYMTGPNSTYFLSNSASVLAGYIGIGNGFVYQTGGSITSNTTFYFGSSSYLSGYFLSGGTINAHDLILNSENPTSFTQTGGTVSVDNSITIGRYTSYSLSSGSLSSTSATLSNSGSSTFSQSGGSATFSSFTLANSPSSSSSLNLSAGTFSLTSLANSNNYIAYAGSATVNQTGGTLTGNQSLAKLTLASQPNSSATYNLSAGQLNFESLTIGDQGSATFNQSGGTVQATRATLSGTYNQSNGSSDFINNLTLANASFPAQYNLTGGSLLTDRLLLNSGTFSQSAGSLSLADGVTVDSPASPALFSLTGGNVGADYFEAGDTATGTISQSGGSLYAGLTSRLGYAAGSHGSYLLSAGTLTAASLYVGESGSGTFSQTGGSYLLNAENGSSLLLGLHAGSTGTYSLSAGSIAPGPFNYNSGITVANAGSATFNQSGGSISVKFISLADASGSTAVYNLSNNGSITVQSLTIGNVGSATFNQSGGNISLTPINPYDPTDLILANAPSSSATYNLSAGSLSTQSTTLGPSGHAYLLQTGGSHSTSSLSISSSSIYDLLAGSLSSSSISNAGTFYMQPHASLTMTGPSPAFSNTSSATLDGSQSWPVGSTFSNSLVTLFHSDPGSTSSSTLNFSSSSPSWAPVLFDAPTLHFASITLSSTTHATLTPTSSYLYTQSLSLTGTAQLNLTTSTLLLFPSSLSLDSIRASLQSQHLISSASDSTHSLAYAPLSLLPPNSPQSTIARLSNTDPNTILITLALTGDLNLDGKLTPDDYALLDRSYAQHLPNPHWTDGDLNYDGTIDQQDYLLIDLAFYQAQGFDSTELAEVSPGFLADRESQFGQPYVQQLLSSLPEPSLTAYLFATLLLPRHRRQQKNFVASPPLFS